MWVSLWRGGNPALARLLEQNRVLLHPFVLGELALGAMPARAEVLRDLEALYPARVAEHSEVLHLVEQAPLWGKGIGWVDAHLIASALLDSAHLWTLDRRLAQVAHSLDIAFAA